MLTLLTAGLMTLTLVTPAAPPVGGGAGWMDDLGPALARARAEGKDLLVDFTGSDWCGWCIRLDDEVFSHDAFLDWADERFVLVALDFPRDGGKTFKAMAPELRARNREQSAALGIQGFPTVMLMTAEGVSYAKTGYQAGGPEAYIEHLGKLRDGPERQALSAAWARVTNLDQATITDTDRDAVYELMGRVSAQRSGELMTALALVDPEDSRGVLSRMALDAFAAEHLSSQDVDMDVAAAALEALLVGTPTVEQQPGFHFYRGLLAAERGEAKLARASLEAMERIGGMPDEYSSVLRERIDGMQDAHDDHASGGEAHEG